MVDFDFYRGKRVLVTGHTGFKGTWMCTLLRMAGAEVTGYALEPPTNPSVFELTGMKEKVTSVSGDIRELQRLQAVFEQTQPEIVIHMAAQPIVRTSYEAPVETYEINVMGTVHVLECVRRSSCVRSFVNVTTDKVYRNREWEWGYREDEELNGYDPYSNSKSCSELVTGSYRNSFFSGGGGCPAISTARAGNVIGGGDFARDRILPDCIRAAMEKREILVRNPYSIRPYQHVLEPVVAYLMIAQRQYEDEGLAGCYNVGPGESDCRTTGELTELFCRTWNRQTGENIRWKNTADAGPHEANFLKLDCSRIKSVLGWHPVWNVEHTMEKIVEWTLAYRNGQDVYDVMVKQIGEYCEELERSNEGK